MLEVFSLCHDKHAFINYLILFIQLNKILSINFHLCNDKICLGSCWETTLEHFGKEFKVLNAGMVILRLRFVCRMNHHNYCHIWQRNEN